MMLLLLLRAPIVHVLTDGRGEDDEISIISVVRLATGWNAFQQSCSSATICSMDSGCLRRDKPVATCRL